MNEMEKIEKGGMKKVYCGECKFYKPDELEWAGHICVCNPEECLHPQNFIDTHIKPNSHRMTPESRNKNNDCKDFESKEVLK